MIAVPDGWNVRKLSDVARVYSGGTPNRAVPSYWDGDIPWVSTAEINASVITAIKERITAAGLNNSAARVAPAGTLLMAMYGQGKTRGKTSILGIDAAMNQACAAIEPSSQVDGGYLLAYLRHNYEQIRSFSNSGGQENLSGVIVKSIPVVLPGLPEQRRIAEAASDTNDLISSLELAIAKRRAVKQGMIGQLLTGKTRLPGFSEPWREVRLRDAGSTYGGLSGKSKDDFGHGKATFVTFIEVIRSARLTGYPRERVNVRAGERQNRVERGDLLFNGSSETPEEVALSAVVDFETSLTTYLNSFCFGYRVKRLDLVDTAYLAYFFRSRSGRNLVSSLAQGSTRYNIAKTKLLEVAPLLPPLHEQRAIVDVLTDCEAQISALHARLDKAKSVKQGMMQQLLTGRTRLPVAEAAL